MGRAVAGLVLLGLGLAAAATLTVVSPSAALAHTEVQPFQEVLVRVEVEPGESGPPDLAAVEACISYSHFYERLPAEWATCGTLQDVISVNMKRGQMGVHVALRDVGNRTGLDGLTADSWFEVEAAVRAECAPFPCAAATYLRGPPSSRAVEGAVAVQEADCARWRGPADAPVALFHPACVPAACPLESVVAVVVERDRAYEGAPGNAAAVVVSPEHAAALRAQAAPRLAVRVLRDGGSDQLATEREVQAWCLREGVGAALCGHYFRRLRRRADGADSPAHCKGPGVPPLFEGADLLPRFEFWGEGEPMDAFLWLYHHVSPEPAGRVFLDVGCNLGQEARQILDLWNMQSGVGYADLVGSIHRAPAQPAVVHCFEPVPFLAEAIAAMLARPTARLVAANDTLRLHQLAMSDEPGEAVMFTSRELSYASSMSPVHAGLTMQVAVPVSTVDAFCDAHGLAAVEMLKIDAEGADPAVLRGARRLIQRGGANVVVLEYGQQWTLAVDPEVDTLRSTVAFLDGSGFDVFLLSSGGLTRISGEDCWVDALEFWSWSNVVAINRAAPFAARLAELANVVLPRGP